MEPAFYQTENGVVLSICGGAPGLSALTANTSEGAAEKHIPVVTVDGEHVSVKVGSVFHPMTEEHSITWVYLQTSCGGQLKYLPGSGDPAVEFALAPGEKAQAAYAYCNLHGFWSASL